FGLIMGAVALLALLGLLSVAWWYIESAGWFDLKVNITIANEKTHPGGEKIDARVGEKVIFNVKSDTDDEIHAHVASNYKLPVQAGKPAKGSFILDQPGNFVVECHHCDGAIVILNVGGNFWAVAPMSARQPDPPVIPPSIDLTLQLSRTDQP